MNETQVSERIGSCSTIANLDGVVQCMVGMMEVAIFLLISFAFVYTVYGAVRFIKAEGNEREEWKKVIMYGIIGIAVMVSVWGLVNILMGTFGFNDETRRQPVPPPRINLPPTSSTGN